MLQNSYYLKKNLKMLKCLYSFSKIFSNCFVNHKKYCKAEWLLLLIVFGEGSLE